LPLPSSPSSPTRRSSDLAQRFYLTFMAGAADAAGSRPMFVRLQLNRAGATTNFSAVGGMIDRDLLDRAPDLDVAGNHVRVDDDGDRKSTRLNSSHVAISY